jgi:hypothetical protein
VLFVAIKRIFRIELPVGQEIVTCEENQGSRHEERSRGEDCSGDVRGGEEVEEGPHCQQHQAGPVDSQDQHVGGHLLWLQFPYNEADTPEGKGQENDPHHNEERLFLEHISQRNSTFCQVLGDADKAGDIDDVFDQEGGGSQCEENSTVRSEQQE